MDFDVFLHLPLITTFLTSKYLHIIGGQMFWPWDKVSFSCNYIQILFSTFVWYSEEDPQGLHKMQKQTFCLETDSMSQI